MTRIMKLPKLGVNMTEATITAWKVAEGDPVTEGQPLFEAETDKAVQEFESAFAGVLEKILAPAGTTVACQEPVASFRIPEQAAPARSEIGPVPQPHENERSPAATFVPPAPPAGLLPAHRPSAQRLRISPLARRTARQLGVDPTSLSPARPGARIVNKDVLARYVRPDDRGSTGAGSLPLTGIRKTIATRMSQSARETASAALTVRVDAAALLAWRDQLKGRGVAASMSVLAASLAGKALERFPLLNAAFNQDRIELHSEINVGIAVDSGRGLIVPVLRQANSRSVEELSEDFRRQVAAANKGDIAAEDLAGGTFTITNLGGLGIESFTPIINPPQCAILALGAIAREAVPALSGAGINVRPIMRLTLVFDHRVVDGAPAARFLQHLRELMESCGGQR